MGRNRDRRIDGPTAERLPAGVAVGLDRLEDLRAAASAPGRQEEMAGEEAAIGAFRQARLAVRVRGVVRRRAAPAHRGLRLLSVKAIALASSVAVAGVALAA